MSFLKILRLKKLSRAFKQETAAYVAQVNAFRALGMQSKWRDPVEMDLPEDPRLKYAAQIYESVLEFNQKEKINTLRDLFPPQTELFYDLTEEKDTVRNIERIAVIKDDLFLLKTTQPAVDTTAPTRRCYLYKQGRFEDLEGLWDFGVCPQKKIYAFLKPGEIVLRRGWDGEILRTLTLPEDGTFHFPGGAVARNHVDLSKFVADHTIPFSDGKRILVVHEEYGAFLIEDDRFTLLAPTEQELEEEMDAGADLAAPDEDKTIAWGDYPMLHAALSHNNRFIALGHQFSYHRLHHDNGVFLGEAEPMSSYPHYALFSKDDAQIMFNACHFYNGSTQACYVEELALEEGTSHTQSLLLDEESRVYAATATSFGYILGDAQGYIRARSHTGEYLWDDYLGFNILTMDITPDETFLYVGTYKGILYKVHLNQGERSPYGIGNSRNNEVTRWMFWERDTILKW